MANTTNFNWETPDDTDLVKDGAAAMRTLGNSIDTSFVDLKGGTTGQILSKASNTDLDYTWVTTDDANAIQNSIVDAKGDLIAATANDTPARLAVGTNFRVLQAQSAETTGLLWAGAEIGFTPTWTADVGSPSIGNGVLSGFYIRYGNLCSVRINFSAGSTTTFGTSGTYYFALPFTSAALGNQGCSGVFYGEDSGVAGYSGIASITSDGTRLAIKIPQSASASWGKTTPFTWAQNDFFQGTLTYQVA